MRTAKRKSDVSTVLFGRTRSAVLALLYGHAEESFYLRQLGRTLGVSTGALQRELGLLVDAGIITRRIQGSQIYFQANKNSPVFSELRGLVIKTVGARDVIRAALTDLAPRIRIAFVYGSVARQEEQANSDIDLMVVGDASFSEAVERVSASQATLNREINPTVYTAVELQAKLKAGNHFLKSVLNPENPKLFVFGNNDELRKLASERMAATAQK